ncbi:hypothetical protein [Natronogracilivirga saccharolytica]|uniref:Curlin associated repeat-containing protein n=1 Tax=Natronogracilivirga saccharolytica TaxID=2812953 RepID=A0A8J7UVK5_9BACT|nr:hypothetical protein [Natronogracilivirga saccharolytica]MBP3192647.1 hypothetical protein [Natronogracilivirga saccharolytica]
MKQSILLVFLMMLATSLTLAQNNNSYINQSADGNKATVSQTGEINDSKINQTTDGHMADVTQDGIENINILNQFGNNSSEYTLVQDGNNNYSRIRQGQFGGSEADITQVGDRNRLTGTGGQATQGTRNILDLNQEGDDHTAHVYQDMADHELYIVQIDLENYARVHQDANNGAIATLTQDGVQNRLFVRQNDWGYHTLTFVQEGNDNKGETTQLGYNNTMDIAQLGNNNLVSVEQGGVDGGNIFMLEQVGNGNQFGEQGNPFMQDGDGNMVVGVINLDGLELDMGNPAVQANGAIFDTESKQIGDNHIIGLSQGAGDWALIQQFGGDGNTALLCQDGGAHEADIIQNGSGNTSVVKQKQ